MNRRQKRKKRMAAREHQRTTATGTKIEEFPDGSRIEVARGPRRRPDSYHAKKQRGLDARATLDKALRELLGENATVDEELRKEFSRLIRATGGVEAAKRALMTTFTKATGKTTLDGLSLGATKHGVQVVRNTAPEAFDVDKIAALDHGDQAYANRVPESDWAELEEAAKRRKRGAKGYLKVLQDAGYELLSDGHDPRERESWVRA